MIAIVSCTCTWKTECHVATREAADVIALSHEVQNMRRAYKHHASFTLQRDSVAAPQMQRTVRKGTNRVLGRF